MSLRDCRSGPSPFEELLADYEAIGNEVYRLSQREEALVKALRDLRERIGKGTYAESGWGPWKRSFYTFSKRDMDRMADIADAPLPAAGPTYEESR